MKISTFLPLLFACGSVQLAAQDVASGLVLHYEFEDNLIETATGQTAETQGTFSYDDGYVGRAIRFDFEDNYFLTPAEAVVPGNTPVSFALFVNHDPTVINTRRQNYLQQLDGGGETGRATLYLQRPDSGTNPDTIISFVGNGTTSSNYKFTTGGEWFHLGLTIDPDTKERVFYVNGAITNRDSLFKDVEPSTGSYIVGHHKGLGNSTITFKGLMDDLRFYDRIVTPEEMALLARELVSGVRPQVVQNGFELAPNPAASGDMVSLTIDRAVFSGDKAISLQVLDMAGRMVVSDQVPAGVDTYTIDRNLAPGMYTLMLADGKHVASEQLSVR